MGGFDTIEDAAQAGITTIQQNEDSKRREFIGLIYQDPESGKFLITEPRGQGKKGKAKSGFKIPKGSARGIFHNHPFDPKTDRKATTSKRALFSEDDANMSKQLNLPSFISVGHEIKKFDPTARRQKKARGGFKGDDVIAEIPLSMLPNRRLNKFAEVADNRPNVSKIFKDNAGDL